MNDTTSISEPTGEEDSPAFQSFISNAILFLSACPAFLVLLLFMSSRLSENFVYVSAFAGTLVLLAILVLATSGQIKFAQWRTILSILFGCLDILPLLLLILMSWALSGLVKGMMPG